MAVAQSYTLNYTLKARTDEAIKESDSFIEWSTPRAPTTPNTNTRKPTRL
jgi:hypothetical protein